MNPDKRILCVWLPQWPLERLAAARPELSRATSAPPVLLYEVQARGGGLKVVAYTPALGRATEGRAAEGRPRTWLPTPTRTQRRASGIRPGMPLAEAIALYEGWLLQAPAGAAQAALHLELYDPLADRLALAQLAESCQRFSPLVGCDQVERPDTLLLDTSGLAPLFGGEQALAADVARELSAQGLTPHVAVASTLGAAWSFAHWLSEFPGADSHQSLACPAPRVVAADQTLAALAPLPVEALRLPEETVARLAELGVRRIEQLMRLPRSSLGSRFGPLLLTRLDQASGAADEVLLAGQPPTDLTAHCLWEHPTARRDAIDATCRQLIGRLTDRLAAESRGILQLECRLEIQDGRRLPFTVGLFRPSADANHLTELVQLRLETMRLRAPLVGVSVSVAAAAPLQLVQRDLFAADNCRAAPRQLAALIDRLTNRLGRGAVLRPHLLPDAQPEYACQYLPAEEAAKTKQEARRTRPKGKQSKRNKQTAEQSQEETQPGEALETPENQAQWRPLRLIMPAVELEIVAIAPDGPPAELHYAGVRQRIGCCWGPERIETGWWRSRCVRRDYYRVETLSGHRFWIYRQLSNGRWYLQGEFD